MADDASFLSRWSQRKARARQGEPLPEPPAAAPAAPGVPAAPAAAAVGARVLMLAPTAPPPVLAPTLPPPEPAAQAAAEPTATPAPPPPTLADVEGLQPDSDFSRFVTPSVDPAVKNAALKKLFTDPHFNVMDGLDVYIDDYGRPDPLPAGLLSQMAQAGFLGLLDTRPAEAPPTGATAAAGLAAAPPAPTPPIETDEDADLRLQPHDGTGRAGPGPHAGPDAGRQC